MTNFTLQDYQSAILSTGRKCKRAGRYLVAQCLNHDEKNPSMQVFDDGWCSCMAGCGRFHIATIFDEFKDKEYKGEYTKPVRRPTTVMEHKYKTYDLYHEWENMPPIPRDHKFKNLPLEVLDKLGWRWDEYKNSYFIPYFDTTRNHIPFAQWRHLSGERRFTFLPEAKPIAYGLWNLESSVLFVCEGTSDMAVLTYCNIPAIAMPSASSGEIMKRFGAYAKDKGIKIVFAGDRDSAGEKLREALDEVCSYRVRQCPEKYKDWGDFYEAEGNTAVTDWCKKELPSHIDTIKEIMGGGVELKIKNN